MHRHSVFSWWKLKPLIMKKILVAFDGTSFSKSIATFAINLAKPGDSLLVGVFLYDLSYAHLLRTYSWDVPYQAYYYDLSKIEAEDEKKIRENIRAFSMQCEDAGIFFKV